MKDTAISFELSSEDLKNIEDDRSSAGELDETALAQVCGGAFSAAAARLAGTFVACNAAFVACNAPFSKPSFVACNAPFNVTLPRVR